METTFDYLRTYATLLGTRILETYPSLQSTKDAVAPRIATLLRKAPLPGNTEAERFDNAVRKTFSVSKEEMQRPEAEQQKTQGDRPAKKL